MAFIMFLNVFKLLHIIYIYIFCSNFLIKNYFTLWMVSGRWNRNISFNKWIFTIVLIFYRYVEAFCYTIYNSMILWNTSPLSKRVSFKNSLAFKILLRTNFSLCPVSGSHFPKLSQRISKKSFLEQIWFGRNTWLYGMFFIQYYGWHE